MENEDTFQRKIMAFLLLKKPWHFPFSMLEIDDKVSVIYIITLMNIRFINLERHLFVFTTVVS